MVDTERFDGPGKPQQSDPRLLPDEHLTEKRSESDLETWWALECIAEDRPIAEAPSEEQARKAAIADAMLHYNLLDEADLTWQTSNRETLFGYFSDGRKMYRVKAHSP